MNEVFSVIGMVSFVTMAAYMLIWARFSSTRRVAAVPLMMAVAEMAMFGLLGDMSNPTVTMLLLGLRAAVLVACALAMRADFAAAKARDRARKRFHIELHNTMEPLRVMRRSVAAAQIDIAS